MDNRTVKDFLDVEDFKTLLKRLVKQAGKAKRKVLVSNSIPIRTITVQMVVDARWLDSTINKHFNYWRKHHLTNPDCTIHDSTSHPSRNNVVHLNKGTNLTILQAQREDADTRYRTARKERDRLKRVREDALPLWQAAVTETSEALQERKRLDAFIAELENKGLHPA